MIYSSSGFIFFVFFAVLTFYFLPQKWRKLWLLMCSFFWYVNWSVVWALWLFGIMILNYFGLKVIERYKTHRTALFSSLLLVNGLIFVFMKIGPVPYGSSFYLFIMIAYIMDIWRSGRVDLKLNWQNFFVLSSFFPLLMGGPIEREKDFTPQLENQSFKWENLIDGVLIFSFGFLKHYLISDALVPLIRVLLYDSYANPYYLLLAGFLGTFQVYIFLSSFCDMGRGVAKCFGISLSICFRPFYYSKGPGDFWQRWNITLGTWIRDYITFPLMLRYGRKVSPSLILLVSFLFVGIWHGISVNWILFGLFNGILIIVENAFRKKSKSVLISRFLVFLLFVGNGLLHRGDVWALFKKVPAWSVSGFWQDLTPYLTTSFFTGLTVLLIIDTIQERKDQVDWYTHFKVGLKFPLALILVILFFYGLNADILTKSVTGLPMYFKI